MENDDDEIGYTLTRREALSVFGATGFMLFGGCRPQGRSAADTVQAASVTGGAGSGSCVARPASIEGPYFVEEKLNRSDIRSDPSNGEIKPGVPLEVTFNVSRLADTACTPAAGLMVDLWQCDAAGSYSGLADNAQGFDTVGQKFLRGYQITDAQGVSRFLTIVPGWYQGRTVHINFWIRTAPTATQSYDFTSQLYFDDALTDRVLAREPYASRGRRDRRNDRDGIYARGGGRSLVLALKEDGPGYAGTFDIGLKIG